MMKKESRTISLDDSIKRFVGKNEDREKLLGEMYEEIKLQMILEQLKQIRRKNGLTLKEIAALMSTSESALSRLERQSKNITVFTLARYAKILGKKIEISLTS
jgi:HTH-type transcriptional regulator / antitoxin HipB